MQTGGTTNARKTQVEKVMAEIGVKVKEIEYVVKKPVFEEVRIEKPFYVEKPIEIPVGLENALNDIAVTLYEKIIQKIDVSLQSVISNRLKEIEVPKIIQREKVVITKIDVPVKNAVIQDVQVKNAIVTDVPIKNAIVVDYKVLNAVIEDVLVKNAVVEDVVVRNAVITDVPVANAKIKDITVECVKPKWLKPDGTPDVG